MQFVWFNVRKIAIIVINPNENQNLIERSISSIVIIPKCWIALSHAKTWQIKNKTKVFVILLQQKSNVAHNQQNPIISARFSHMRQKIVIITTKQIVHTSTPIRIDKQKLISRVAQAGSINQHWRWKDSYHIRTSSYVPILHTFANTQLRNI